MSTIPHAFRMLTPSRPAQPLADRLVHLCAWCDPRRKRAREAAAHALDCAVSHGICPTCKAAMLADLQRSA